MDFQILKSTNPRVIAEYSARLDVEQVRTLSEKAKPILGRLSYERFIFLMGSLASYGTNFTNNLDLIDNYFSIVGDLNVKLCLEDDLHRLFLRKYETEESYDAFYRLMQRHYATFPRSHNQTDLKLSDIVFFVHSPVFLAHTNALFKLLENRGRDQSRVTICSMRYNEAFARRCQDLNVTYKVFEDIKLSNAYNKFVDFAKFVDVVVWLSVPVHLSYVSRHLKNVILWSHKFHPNFTDILGAIGVDPMSRATFTNSDRTWWHFESTFNVANVKKEPNAWNKRKYRFASVCREELIDNESHWKNVHDVLKCDTELQYYYCGRSPVHLKWCRSLRIPIERVNYVGWLAEPAEFIRDQMFLLDGPKLGHGLMASEALCCGIPIVSPKSSYGNYKRLMLRLDEVGMSEEDVNQLKETIFDEEYNLMEIVKKLSKKHTNDRLGKFSRQLFDKNFNGTNNFSDFKSLICSIRSSQ